MGKSIEEMKREIIDWIETLTEEEFLNFYDDFIKLEKVYSREQKIERILNDK